MFACSWQNPEPVEVALACFLLDYLRTLFSGR